MVNLSSQKNKYAQFHQMIKKIKTKDRYEVGLQKKYKNGMIKSVSREMLRSLSTLFKFKS